MSTEENKAIARRFYEEFWTKHRWAAFDELIATDIIDHDPWPGQGPGGEGMKQQLALILAGFPDACFTVDVMIAEGDLVASRLTVTATQTGEFMGIPPTGKKGMINGIDIFRIAGGKIVERWGTFDILSLMQQIGVVPPPGQTGR